MNALYLRAANALERSAALAEAHAERLRDHDEQRSARLELDKARQAREAAKRGRLLASRVH